MKIHRPVIEQIVLILQQIFGLGGDPRAFYADKVLERAFKANRRLGGRDRRLIAESTYDIVRWWRLLWAILERDLPQANRDGIWRVVGVWLALNDYDFPSWPEFHDLDTKALKARRQELSRQPAIHESFPDWIYQLGESELGAKWHEVAQQLNQPAPVFLRANRLRTTRENLLTELKREDVTCSFAPGTEDGLVLSERRNVFTSESFKLGMFEVQDGASQQAAPLLNPQPGERVIDGCAGAGGKTLHLAAMMKNKGRIIALDVHQKKLDELRKRCTRNGVDIVENRLIEGPKTIKRLSKSADRVLLDVPCTGLGVFRRNPDAKWKLKPEDFEHLSALQIEILENYSDMVKPGGHLVYSTCSILPSENLKRVEAFLAAHADDWTLISERTYWPGENQFDGFYTALMKRQ